MVRSGVRRRVAVGVAAAVIGAATAAAPSVAVPSLAVPAPGVPVTLSAKVTDFVSDGVYLDTLQESDGRLFFSASARETGKELWTSDGTTEGTRLVKDIWPGPADDPFDNDHGSGLQLNAFYDGGTATLGGIFYFVADDGVHGSTLWRSDGTESGTWMVKDVVPSATDGFEVEELVVAGDELFFGAPGTDTDELWKSDGTSAGTVKVADAGYQPSGMTPLGDGVVFAVYGNVANGELWASDGTAAGTGPLGGPAGIFGLTAAGDYAYWAAGNKQLWRTDGTPGGTQRVANDLRPGDDAKFIDGLTAVGTTLFYNIEYDPFSAGDRYELRKVGGASSAALVRGFDFNDGGNLTGSTLAAGGFLYFIPKPVPGNRYPGRTLWRSDGTAIGTVQIATGYLDFLSEAVGRVYVTTYDVDAEQWWLNEVGPTGVSPVPIAGPFGFPFGEADYVAPAPTPVGDTLFFRGAGDLWKIGDDLAAPDTVITEGFAEGEVVTSYGRSVRGFTASRVDDFTPSAGASLEWRIDNGPWEKGYGADFGFPVPRNNQLNEGVHTVSARTIDAAGRVDPSPATRTFTIDLVPPGPLDPLSDPRILGNRQVGETLTVKSATWSSSPTQSTFQWLRNGTAIAGATGATYRVVLADIGTRLSVRERATSPTETPGTATSATVGIAKVASTTTLRMTKKRVRAGTRAVAVVAVTPAVKATLSGVVTLRAGRTKVGTVAPASQGFSVRLAKLPRGTYQLTATYSGNSQIAGSKSKPVKLVVSR